MGRLENGQIKYDKKQVSSDGVAEFRLTETGAAFYLDGEQQGTITPPTNWVNNKKYRMVVTYCMDQFGIQDIEWVAHGLHASGPPDLPQ